MLYVSTRNRTDSFTAYRALHEERTPDGGLFVPHRLPILDNEVQEMMHESFGANVAKILNHFFSVGLTGWDVDFIVGRHPLRFVMMNHRLVVAELWRNHASDYAFIETSLFQKMAGSFSQKPTDWAKIAIRIAILFGVFSELFRQGIESADVAVPTGDFSLPIAAWYARRMGLPVGRIICGCNENGDAWDLIHRGEFSTANRCPVSIERLIYHTLGLQEAQRYWTVCQKRGVYKLEESVLMMLNDGFSAAVVSKRRVQSVIKSTYRTGGYIMDDFTAVAYGSLQDYRSHTGESKLTLLLADRSPIHSSEELSTILELSANEIKNQL